MMWWILLAVLCLILVGLVYGFNANIDIEQEDDLYD